MASKSWKLNNRINNYKTLGSFSSFRFIQGTFQLKTYFFHSLQYTFVFWRKKLQTHFFIESTVSSLLSFNSVKTYFQKNHFKNYFKHYSTKSGLAHFCAIKSPKSTDVLLNMYFINFQCISLNMHESVKFRNIFGLFGFSLRTFYSRHFSQKIKDLHEYVCYESIFAVWNSAEKTSFILF